MRGLLVTTFVIVLLAAQAHAIGVIGGGANPSGAGAATSANQVIGNSSLNSIDGKTPALGQTTMSASVPVTLASDQSALPLPTGAATAAKQDTGNTSLSSVDGKLGSLGQKAMAGSAPVVISSDQTAVPISAASLPLPTGAATSAKQDTGNTSLSSIDTKTGKQPINTTGSGATSTVSTVATLTAPANAVGFMIEALDTNTATIRFGVGITASATVGAQLQPGRSEYLGVGANVSICAESGTQGYVIQWVSQ